MRNRVVLLCTTVWLFGGTALVADPQAVAHVYDGLLQKQLEERQNAFIQLSGPDKAAVWTHHLLTALAERPELTTEQRAVIQYALSILTPAFAELDPADPQWDQVVGQPLRELERRASAVFTRKQIISLFGQLGPEPAGASRQPAVASLDVIQVPQCHCNTSPVADFCDRSGIGLYYCSAGGCWPTTSGCGWLWRASCNGVCIVRQGGGGG